MIERKIKEDKYLNKVKIIFVNIWEEGVEEDVFIKINERELKCFRSCVIEQVSFIKGDEGKEYIVQLTLMTTDSEKIEDKEKYIHTEERRGWVNHCILKGQIRAIYEIDGPFGGCDCAVVDCGGIFVGVEVSPEDNFKIGDYIKAEGRLDIWKAEEVEKEKGGED